MQGSDCKLFATRSPYVFSATGPRRKKRYELCRGHGFYRYAGPCARCAYEHDGRNEHEYL